MNNTRRFLEEVIQRQIMKRGVMISKIMSKERITQLIESLHPYQTQFDLIRLGPNGDGGYLVPNDLFGVEACFSPGVGMKSEFELQCIRDYGMKVFMADKSVDKPNIDITKSKYNFLKKFIGSTNNKDFITVDNWVKSNRLPGGSELLLQMDIEGGEYNSIINMSDSLLSQFRIMIIEFHWLHFLWQPRFFDFAEIVFEKILQTHLCVHIHPNNCCGIDARLGIEIPKTAEFTFIRRDRVEIRKNQNRFPHKLDFDNTEKRHIPLPHSWYKYSK